MAILKVILMMVEVLCCTLLIGVILLQKTKDEGLGLAFGAAVGETLFGSRAGNVLTKITIGLAVVFLVNTLVIGLMSTGGAPRSLVDKLPAQKAMPVQPQPAGTPGDSGAGSAMPGGVPAPAPVLPSAPSAPATPAPVTPAPAPAGGTL
jgi:preprotein translocase subunit SecG